MADTLDCHELKAIILLGVARDLTIGEPGPPGVLDGPAEVLDPPLGAVSGDSTIGVARVEHEVGLVTEDAVDPNGSLILHVVAQRLGTHFPGLSA